MNTRFVSGKCRVRHSTRQSLPSLRLVALRVRLTCLRLRLKFLTCQPQKEKEKDTPSGKSVPVGTLRARGQKKSQRAAFHCVRYGWAAVRFRYVPFQRLRTTPKSSVDRRTPILHSARYPSRNLRLHVSSTVHPIIKVHHG